MLLPSAAASVALLFLAQAALSSSSSGGSLGPPVPPPQTAAQQRLVAAWERKADVASRAGTTQLLALLGRPSIRQKLPLPLRGLDAAALLAKIEAQLAVTEVIHQFKPAKPASFEGDWCSDCAEGSESDGNPPDRSLSATFVRNLWEMGVLNETSRTEIEGWCTGTSAAERFLCEYCAPRRDIWCDWRAFA